MDTSKLFDRFDRDMPIESGANVFDDCFGVIGVSSTLLISVADDVNEDISVIRSFFVTTIPDFFRKLDVVLDTDGEMHGFSDARRLAGIGVRDDATKSEYRRLEYRFGELVPATSTV